MNTYLISYQFKGQVTQIGSYQGKAPSEAAAGLEKAGALIYSIILVGAF